MLAFPVWILDGKNEMYKNMLLINKKLHDVMLDKVLLIEFALTISNKSFTNPNKRAHLILLKNMVKFILELIVNFDVMLLNDTTKLLLFVTVLIFYCISITNSDMS